MNNEIAHALRQILEPGQVTELRILDAVTRNYPRAHVESGYFDDPDKLAATLANIDDAKGFYFTPNPVNPDLLARASNRIRPAGKAPTTSDADIVRRRWLLIDCDPVRPAGISATDAERNAAHDRAMRIRNELHEIGWPWPIVADSGNGAHLMYRIDLPADDDERVKRCLEALAETYNDETVKVDRTVHNPARIWKLPGTWAKKGDSTPARPHRKASLLNVPETLEIVPIEMLEALAAKAASSTTLPSEHKRNGRINESPATLRGYLEQRGVNVQTVKTRDDGGVVLVLNGCPMNPDHGHNSDTAVVLRPDGKIGFECKHDRCLNYTWPDLRRKIDPDYGKVAATTPQQTIPDALPFVPFPVDALPNPVRPFITKAAKAIGCDASFIAIPLLAGLASAIGNMRRIQLKRSWTEPAILWAVVVGDSGTLKSPAIELALRPIRKRQRDAMKRHSEATALYAIELADWERAMAQWKKAKNHNDAPTKPIQPVADRCWCDDATVEALAVLLQQNSRGLLLIRDELAGWVKGFDCYKNGKGGDVAKWLEMFGGRPMVVDRKSGNPPMIYVERAAVSVTGGIQPGTLDRVMTSDYHESGLLARLLFAYPPRKPKKWSEADIDPEAEAAIESVFDTLYDLQPDTDENETPTPHIVALTPEGKEAWVKFYNAHAAEHAELTGDLSAAWSKLEGYAARLALVTHFIRWAAGDPTLDDPEAVDESSIAAGVELSQWFGHECRRVYAMLAESDEDRDRRRLVEKIQRKGGELTARELQQSDRQYRTADDAECALSDLVKARCGQWVDRGPTPRGGRPTQVFRLNRPPVSLRNPEDSTQNGGSVCVDSVDSSQTTDPDNAPGGDWGEL